MVSTLVIAVCAARALHAGVQLIDERALFEIRARDVFSRHPPLLGLSSSSAQAPNGINHPGPALFWWLAPFVRLLGGPVGVTVGIASLNIASVWTAVLAARASGGARFAFAIGAAATALCWSLGSEVLVDPWQPNALVLPFFALLATTTAVVCGRWWWLVATTALASLCTQTHLGYLLLGPAMVATATAAIVWRSKRECTRLPRRVLGVSAIVLAVMWAPVLWQQFVGPGGGNLGAVLRAASSNGTRTGLGLSLRVWSSVTLLPPAWFRPSYLHPPQALFRAEGGGRAVLDLGQLPSAWLTFVAVVVAVGVGVLVVESARRRRIDSSSSGMLVLVVGTVVAVLTIALLPVELFGVVAHKYRYLWSLAAFGAAVVVAHAVWVAEYVAGRRAVRWTIGSLATATALCAVLAIPTLPVDQGVVSNRDLWPALHELRSQLTSYRPSSVVEVETSGLPFPDYYSHAVLAQLSANDVAFQVTTEAMVRQLGPARRADGSADDRLVIRQEPHEDEPANGGRLVASVDVPGAPAVAVYAVSP